MADKEIKVQSKLKTAQKLDADIEAATEPWMQMRGEPLREFTAFELYRQYGVNRRYSKVVDEFFRKDIDPLDRKTRDIAAKKCMKWATRWNWTMRALEWDRFLHNERVTVERDELAKMKKRHMDTAKIMGMRAFEAFNKKAVAVNPDTGKTELENLGITTLADLMQQGNNMERKAAELPDQTVTINNNTASLQLTMSADEVAARLRHVVKLATGIDDKPIDMEKDFVHPVSPALLAEKVKQITKTVSAEVVDD